MTKLEPENRIEFQPEGSLIDWKKAEMEPEKKLKLPGHVLLGLRAKFEYLKEQLELANKDIVQLKGTVHSLSEEQELFHAKNKASIGEREEIIRNLKNQNDTLTQQVEKSNMNVSELEISLRKKDEELEEISKASGKEISEMRSSLGMAKSKILELKDEIGQYIPTLDSKDEEINTLTSMVKKIDSKKVELELQLIELKESFELNRDSKIKELIKELAERDKSISLLSLELKDTQEQLDILKPPDLDKMGFSSEKRVTCPICGAVGKDIRSIEDKNKILYHSGLKPMYAKRNICLKCGYEDF